MSRIAAVAAPRIAAFSLKLDLFAKNAYSANSSLVVVYDEFGNILVIGTTLAFLKERTTPITRPCRGCRFRVLR